MDHQRRRRILLLEFVSLLLSEDFITKSNLNELLNEYGALFRGAFVPEYVAPCCKAGLDRMSPRMI